MAEAQARSQNDQAQKQLADLQRMGKDELAKAARGTKESAEGHYHAAAAQLSYTEIRSPIDGVVTDRPAYVGDLAAANQPILTVMDTSRIIAKAHIPQPQAVLLKPGDAAKIIVPGIDDPVAAQVTLVSPALDPGSTTLEVWVETRKPNPLLKPGMTVNLDVAAKTVKDVVAAPACAIFKNAEGESYVLLAGPDHKAHKTVVQLGVSSGDNTQIVSGVNAGDPIISSGGYGVPDETAIQIERPAASKAAAGDASKDQE